MSVKSAVGVFMPGTQNSLKQTLLPMGTGLVQKKNSRPGQLKALINIQDRGANHDL